MADLRNLLDPLVAARRRGVDLVPTRYGRIIDDVPVPPIDHGSINPRFVARGHFDLGGDHPPEGVDLVPFPGVKRRRGGFVKISAGGVTRATVVAILTGGAPRLGRLMAIVAEETLAAIVAQLTTSTHVGVGARGSARSAPPAIVAL